MEERLDIVIFGASGFTGKFTLPEVHKLNIQYGQSIKWGIAGRSEEKLKEVLTETSRRIGGTMDLSSIPVIIADINNEESIRKMTKCAKIIINCSGPYDICGEVVVKCCIETGTHYVDVSAETHFQEMIQSKYHEAAEEKGIYIVTACGFGSIPADLGVIFLENNFNGCLNSMEIYLDGYEEGGFTGGAIAHSGTWDSAINLIGNLCKVFATRKNLKLKPLPELRPALWPRLPFTSPEIPDKRNKWVMPVPSPDREIISRSQHYFYEQDKKRPVQAFNYLLIDSFCVTLKCIFYTLMVVILAQFKCGRNLLVKYPIFFSSGLFSKEGPSEDRQIKLHYSFTLLGKGWDKSITEDCFHYTVPPNKEIIGRVSGVNPGYGITCVAVALSAIIILTQLKNLPQKGGVFTTAAAFSKTTFIEELQNHGVTFEILSIKNL